MNLVWLRNEMGDWEAQTRLGVFRVYAWGDGCLLETPWSGTKTALRPFETIADAKRFAAQVFEQRTRGMAAPSWWPGFVTGTCVGIVMGAGLAWWLMHGL